MKAYVVNEPGGPEKLKLTKLPRPTVKENEVLVKVRAVSINPVDAKTRAGKAFYNTLKRNCTRNTWLGHFRGSSGSRQSRNLF